MSTPERAEPTPPTNDAGVPAAAGAPDRAELARTCREAIAGARRIVVKVGSSSLTGSDGVLDTERLRTLVDAIAARHSTGREIVLVSSGAIAAGIGPLGLTGRPKDLETQQAAASVGQGALVAAYSWAFAAHGYTVGQVLLTADDLTRKQHYANARRAIRRLLAMGVVPVVNENDAVATNEIRFGDNDRLAALVAHLIAADALILLSDVDALYDGPPSQAGSSLIPLIAGSADLAAVRIGGTGSGVGTGGMVTKVEAARIATGAGVPTVLTSTAQAVQALAGEPVGTLFTPTAPRPASRMLWLAHASATHGRLVVDDGAVRALSRRTASLLPAGIVAIEGRFEEGAAVEVTDRSGDPVARGLVSFSSDELPELLGRSTHWLGAVKGERFARPVIHRDHLVVL